MRRFICILLVSCMAAVLCAACGGDAPSAGADTRESAAGEDGALPEPSRYKIAMLSDPIGNEQFILQAYNALERKAEQYGFAWTSIECVDIAAWEENARGAVAEGYDLLVAVGWQAAAPFSALADEYPDTKFAVIDTVAENDKVKSISFNTAEGCYVLGAMVGAAFPEEALFGYVCNFQDQASYEYRYGFTQGLRSVKPDAQVMFNYANSYSDTSIVYELALQQQAAGCTFIFGGVSNSSNAGIYQAALELADKGTPIYTTGLSTDQTSPDNPYIIGGVTKQTDLCMERVVDAFLAGEFQGGAEILGIREGGFGVVGITTDGFGYRNTDIVTDAVLEAGRAARDAIVDGAVTISVPMEGAEAA